MYIIEHTYFRQLALGPQAANNFFSDPAFKGGPSRGDPSRGLSGGFTTKNGMLV
jgi:hypothetical protein